MKLFLGILLAAGAAVGFMQQRRIEEMRAAIEAQMPTVAEADRLREQIDATKKAVLTAEQIAAMRAERSELMRLRAGIADLRVAAQSPERIEAEIAKLNEAAAREETTATMQRDSLEASHISKAMRGMMDVMKGLVRTTERANGGRVPRSFEEVKTAVKDSGRFPNFDQMWEGLSKGYPPFNITLNHFEFVPASATPDGILIMRERQARRLPDGSWTRLYLTGDDQIKEVKLMDGDFAAWEQENFN